MRLLPALALAFLLAGCSSPIRIVHEDQEIPLPEVEQAGIPEAFDHLSPKLPASSGEFQQFAVTEDAVPLPGGGYAELHTGRGMHCFDDADGVASGTTGWVACALRLARDPDAMAQGVHDLGIGEDTTRLSLRMASEPVEWRVVIVAREGNLTRTAFDSGWRAVDLSPGLAEPLVAVDVVDPCDALDAQEQPPLGSRRGQATLKLEGMAWHGRVSVAIDTMRSHPLDAQPGPTDVQTVGDHTYLGVWKVIGSPRALAMDLAIDLEAPETLATPTVGGACGSATLAHESQEWTVLLAIAGADGRVVSVVRTVQVDVALAAYA